MLKKTFPFYWSIVKQTGTEFMANNPTRLAASLSYYTLFSLAPMLLTVIALAGFFFGREAVEGQIYGQINGLIGGPAAKQVQDLLKNTQQSGESVWAAVLGFVTLLIGATGTFAEMQDAINLIWGLKQKPGNGILQYFITRILSFSLVVSLGFLLVVSLAANALLNIFSERAALLFSDATYYLFWILNVVVVWGVIALLFTVIFKVLPNCRIALKDAFVGAGFTSVLFMVGKYGIELYLGQSNIGSAYGAAGSVVIILVWVYYSSLILFFGAAFTKVYANKVGQGIRPNP